MTVRDVLFEILICINQLLTELCRLESYEFYPHPVQ